MAAVSEMGMEGAVGILGERREVVREYEV